MDIKSIKSKEEMLSDKVLDELFGITNIIERERYICALKDKAKLLSCKTEFEAMIRAYQRAIKIQEKRDKEEKKNTTSQALENYTSFGYFDDGHELFSGNWIADYNGVRTFSMFGELLACYHPILPVKRLTNIETGEEQIVIAFYRNKRWKEIKVQKSIISNASKITNLATYGVAVTSENAKYLVKYLSDVENFNDELIDIQSSTSKLGWNGKDFIPYDKDIAFDGDIKFKNLFDSIHTQGDSEAWYKFVSELRATGKKEIKFMIASALASILVGKFRALPFIVDLWGFTEGGKSVSMMLACSVWANPDESQYIGDLKSTDVALETKADLLNNLPMLIDDTSQTSAKLRDNFENVVYQLCSGKGKTRSNKDLGVNRENHWRNCFITNGEKPLNSYVSQGGAINRILEVECSEKIYDDPQQVASFLKSNYGWCGQDFVDVIKNMTTVELEAIRNDFQSKLIDAQFTQKQIISLSIILTADAIADEYLFKDGHTITLKEAKTVLTDLDEVSDYKRCYEFLLDKINMNSNRFDVLNQNIERWGVIEGQHVYFFVQAFNDLCKSGNYNAKSFLAWGKKNNVVIAENDRATKQKKIDGKNCRCVCIKLSDNLEATIEGKEEFIQMDLINDEDLPFK